MAEERFVDADSFLGKQGELTFQMIVLRHLTRLLDFGSREWRGGYWNKKYRSVSGSAFVENFYVEDSREVFGHGVDRLADLLFPHFDKEMKDAEAKIRKAIAEEYGKHKDKKDAAGVEPYYLLKIVEKEKLFRALNQFLKRQRYFEGKKFTE